jgi:large subunit ribosomal protein L13
MRTSTPKPADPNWLLIDAEGKSLGRLAARVAHILRGKHKVSFSPHLIHGDHIIIINAEKLSFPQKKLIQKVYQSHTGYTGNLKEVTLGTLLAKNPEKVVTLAVTRMLPHNRMRNELLKRLHVYKGDTHPHSAQQPQPFELASSST